MKIVKNNFLKYRIIFKEAFMNLSVLSPYHKDPYLSIEY